MTMMMMMMKTMRSTSLSSIDAHSMSPLRVLCIFLLFLQVSCNTSEFLSCLLFKYVTLFDYDPARTRNRPPYARMFQHIAANLRFTFLLYPSRGIDSFPFG
jgi:hypothetical protein